MTRSSSDYYEIFGRKVPRVTAICGQLDKPALTYWAANTACDYILSELGDIESRLASGALTAGEIVNTVERARKEFIRASRRAMDIGSRVHAAIEFYLRERKEQIIDHDQVVAGFLAFLEWADRYDLTVLSTEQTVYDPLLRYAGTCDLLARLGRNLYVIDFKTSKIKTNAAYPEHRYQVAAYRQTEPEIKGCGVLYLDKETGTPIWCDTSSTYEQDVAVFNCLVDLWYARKEAKDV